MNQDVPEINSRFICICDINHKTLTAVVASYLMESQSYLPIFQFPRVHIANFDGEINYADENVLSVMLAQEEATLINNALARIGIREVLILIGLSEEQKSYLDFLKTPNIDSKVNVIEIDSLDVIDLYLSSYVGIKEKVDCQENQVLEGLYFALKNNKTLSINNDAPEIIISESKCQGIVIVEDYEFSDSIAVICYAHSINASIHVVEKLEKNIEETIQSYIEDWRRGDNSSYDFIKDLVQVRIRDLDISKFEFATFFTYGLPYSLVMGNLIPSSYVNLRLRPDHFIINSILFAGKELGAAVVFSPKFFEDEETRIISDLISANSFFVKELFDKQATVLSLDMHIKEFPFDLLHICSHGGEIIGNRIESDFTDQTGKVHKVVYDQILSISTSSRKGLLTVQRKYFFRKFDGMIWRSQKLKSYKIPHQVFADMNAAIMSNSVNQSTIIERNIVVTNSCAIKCSDGNYQGMFQPISHKSGPIVFNNACWSAYDISDNFLAGGVRGYIGTLWAVNNDEAINFATSFYKNVFVKSILESFHDAMKSIDGSASANIYILYGLHFLTLSKPRNLVEAKTKIVHQLVKDFHLYKNKFDNMNLGETKDIINDRLNWISGEIRTNFWTEYSEETRKLKEIKKKE